MRLLTVGADHVLEQQAPNHIHPTDGHTENGHKDRENQRQGTLGVDKGRPPNQEFDNPVHAGDKQENDLSQSGKTVEPSDNTVVSHSKPSENKCQLAGLPNACPHRLLAVYTKF
jgi:hypothetical protein